MVDAAINLIIKLSGLRSGMRFPPEPVYIKAD
jgi:hypothetical protein